MLEVSESGYYRYLKNKGKPEKDTLLSDEMQKILKEHPCNDNYGAPRMKQALEQRGFTAGLRRITRIMREHGWLHTPRRRPKGLTKADPAAMAAENLIKQDFSAEEPFRKLLTDITQIQCADGKLYISPILDCFNGEVLSLCMRDNMKKELCIDTVHALKRYPVKDAILHSDRGSQYTSAAFRETLEVLHIRQSLSGVDHCYDNARMESFFATLKRQEFSVTSLFTTTSFESTRAIRAAGRRRSFAECIRSWPHKQAPKFETPLRYAPFRFKFHPVPDFGCFPTALFLTSPFCSCLFCL